MEKFKELLGEKLYSEVTGALKGKGREGKDIELAIANDGSFLPKAKFDALNKDYQVIKERLNGVDEELTAAIAMKSRNTELEDALNLAKEEKETTAAKFQEDMVDIAKKHSLEKVLNSHGAKNTRAVEALLNWEAIAFEDGKLKGVDDQLNQVKEDAPYLFSDKSEVFSYQPRGSRGNPDYNQMSDAEYYQFLNMKG